MLLDRCIMQDNCKSEFAEQMHVIVLQYYSNTNNKRASVAVGTL